MRNLDLKQALTSSGWFGDAGSDRIQASSLFANPGNDKISSLMQASAEKTEDLIKKERIKADLLRARDAKTLVSKWGMEPDSVPGYLTNAVVGFGNAVSQLTGRVASGVYDARGLAYSGHLDDSVLAARQRELAGKATSEDITLLNRPQGKLQDVPAVDSATLENLPVAAQRIINRTGGPTNRDLVQKMESAQRDAQTLRAGFDFSKYVHQGNKDALVNDLKEGAADDLRRMELGYEALKDGNVLSGLGDMASGFANSTQNIVRAAANNPLGLTDFTIDSAPQMLASAAGAPIAIGASALYGLDNYGKGLQAYSQKNGGAIAPADERTRMGLLAASTAAAEYAGNAMLGLNRFVKGSAKAVDDLAAEAVQGVSRNGLKDALRKASNVATKNPVSQWAGGIAKGAAGEYPTEGYQTWAENSITGDSTALEDIYTGAAIGAASGGLMSSGVPMVGTALAVEGTKALAKGVWNLPGTVATAKEKLQAGKAQKEAVDTATKTGNVDALLDGQTAAYSPSKALSALFAHNKLDETDNDTRDANVNKGFEILSTMEEDLRALKAQTPQGKQEIQQELTDLKAKITATDPADTQVLEGLNQTATKLESLLATPLAQGAEAKKLGKRIESQVKDIEAATALHEEMSTHAIDKMLEGLDLDEEVGVADTKVDVNDAPAVAQATASAQKIITLSMRHKDRLSVEQATQLASNTDNGLSQEQRAYFDAFSKARLAETAAEGLKQVNKEVLYGNPKRDQLGIKDYRERVTSALASGSKKIADRNLSMLDNFVSSHTEKLKLAQETLTEVNQTGQAISYAKNKTGGWERQAKPFPNTEEGRKAQKEAGGFTILPRGFSNNYIAAVEAEKNALEATKAELQAAYNLKFKPTVATNTATAPVTTVSPTATTTEEITNGAQTPQAVQATQEGPQASADTGAAGTVAVTQPDQTINQPESPQVVNTEGNVDQINAFEGNVENQAKNEQVSSSLNSAKSLSDQDHLFILKDLYPEKQIRALNGTEQQLVNAALDIVKSEFGGTLEVPSRVFAHDGAKAYGWFYATNGIISVNVTGITNRLMPSVGVTDQVHAIASVIAHEMAHHRDAQLGYLSRKAGMLYAGKAVYEEAKASVAKNPVLDYWFGRLVFSHNDAQKQAFELYAQLFALYALNKELFRENLPTGYALIQQAVSAGVREAAPSSVQRVSDGGTNSGSTEESSAASTSEDGASRVQPGDQSDRVGSEEVTPEPVDKTPVEPGKLQAFSVEVPEGTTFKDRNLVASDLKQSAGGDGVVTQRPLVAAKDFLSQWKKKGNGFLAQYLGKEWNELNDKQQKLLEKFRDTAIDWAPKFQASIGKKDESKSAFYFQDMMQFLIQSTNVDGKTAHDVEENIKTAMSYALYSWVAENAARSAFNEHEDINKILNRDKDHEVSEREEELLASVGARDEVIINSLGQRAVAALGISAKQTANKDTLSRLEVALGTHIMRVLSDSGMLKRTSVTGLELAAAQSNLPSYDHLPQDFQNLFDQFVANPPLLESYRNSDLDFTGLSKDQREAVFATYKQFKELASTQHAFLKIARDGQNKLPAETASIYESVVGSQGVLDSLFSVEAGLKEPSLEPIPFNKKNTKGTRSWIPKKLADILEKLNQQASYVKEDHWLLWGKLGVDALHKMAGAKDASETVTHVSERKGIEAKNDGLLREIQRFQDFVNAAIVPQGKPVSEVGMYFSHEPWKQQRVGIETSMVNPQASKLQRFMLFQKSWATKVDPSNESQLNNFKLRVAEGFGVKTDRQNMVKSLADAEAKINDPKTQAAVQAIIETVINKGEMTAEHQAAIVAGVKEGGEKFHSMDALIALARYQHADGQPFTVHMMGEIDGVTNGPMLTHILYGAAKSAKELFALINKGGFYENGSEHSQYNVWRGEPGQKDLYESTTLKVMAHALGQLNINPHMEPVWDAVWHFTGDLGDGIDNVPKAGRDIIKTPLTALIFGSSTYRAKLSTSEKFVSSIHRAIAELKDDDNEARIQAIEKINTLLGNKAPKWNLNMTVQEMRNTKFSVRQIEAIQNTFNRTLGESVEVTLKESFKDLLERRDAINASAALAFTLYQSTYDALRKEFVAKTLKPGEDLGKTGEALHDLTQEQEAELERAVVNMFPMLQTYMSLESGQDKAGLEMRKSSRRLSSQRAYRNEIVFGEGGFKPEGQDKAYKTLTVHGNEQTFEAPGVRMFSMGVHSLDSGISHFAAALSEVLNIHDAHGTGLGNFFNAANNLNHQTWNALLNYSPAEQMYQALEKTITGFAEVLSREDTKPEVAAAVKKAVQALMTKAKYAGSMEMFLTESLTRAKTEAFIADKTKLETLIQMKSIDQYALEGGNYEVTKEDRAEAQAKLDKLLEQGSGLSEKTWESLDMVSMALTDKPAFRPKTSPWGEQGKSSIASDQDLVKQFVSNGNQLTAKEAAKYLSDRLKNAQDANGYSGFKRKLLGRVLRSMDPNTVIKYVTPDTPASEVMSKPEDNSRGWISINPATGKAEIYVLSEEHLHSGLTDETLLHEMVHAATALAIRAGQAKANEAATALVADLEQLLKAATAKVNSDPKLQAKYENMVESLDELVAWGMSDMGFQDDILKQIQLAPRPRGGVINRTISGMRQFINSLTQFLFGENTPDKRNGMQALIENTTALMKVNGNVSVEGDITTLSQKSSDPVNRVAAYSTEDIYDALDDGSVSPAFSSQLKNLLNGIVHKLHGPFGSIKAKLMESRALSPQDVWLKTLDTGKAPFASEALNAGFSISEQEAFVLEQVEVTVAAALKDNEGQTTAVYSELRKLYAEAARKLKPSDFSDPDLYDFLFKVEAGADKRSDYLSRFAAVGLAHEEVSKLLQFYTDRDTRTLSDAKTLRDKLHYLFDKALTLLNGKLTRTRDGMQAGDKLNTLVEQLIAIEDKKRRRLVPKDKNFLSSAEELANNLTDGAREKVTALLKSDFVKNNKNGFIKLGATVATISAQGQVGQVLSGIQKIKDQHLQQKNGLIMGLVNDVRGPKAWLEQLLRMRKKQEHDRKFVITETGKSVLAGFSKELSTEQKAAVTAVFMRTDLKSLLGHYEISEIQELLEDPAALRNAIIEHEAELRQFKDFQHYYVHQSKALAFQMAHGQARSAMVMMNAGNIAKLLGTRHMGKVSEAQAKKAEAIIDRLTSLYALSYTESPQKPYLQQAKDVLRDEMNRSDGGNGVELVLKLHKAMEEEAKATLFQGNEVLMMKGYTPEIYNPHTDVKVATTPEELRELKLQGYSNEGPLKQDTADGVLPGGWVMVLRDGGLQPWQTGAMSFTGRQAKGSKMQSNYTNPFDEQGLHNANNLKNVLQAKQAEIDRMFQPNPGFNPATEKRNFMVPVMNSTGTISNWRYMMSNQLKDRALDRDSRVDQVLGMLAGSTFDKQTAGEVNRQVVEALKEHADKEFPYHPKSFVQVSRDSSDPEMRELYAMLPKETRDDIRRVWGQEGMRVPYEMLDVVFGYRKASLSSIWEKEKRNMAENALVFAVESMLYHYGRYVKGLTSDEAEDYSQRGAVTMRRAENIWQEIVRETKDTIVVKTGTVLFDNILSNMSLLTIHGVSPLEMIRHHRVAFKAARAYQADKSRLFQLQQQVDLGTLSPEQERKALVEITKLEDAIARNPVMPLIEAGLMPTIVEDVAADEDIYSYKSQLARKLGQYEDKVHPMVSKAARTVYMAHDTSAYKFLSEATQLSDFVARYTLYQHLTTKKNNPLSHEAAVREASESFINYDVPMHKSMQYFDDMGIIPFMKYTLRIQRVLVRLTRDHPARMLSAVLLNNMFDALPLVTDSGMLGRIGNNPLQWGAFKYPTVLDDLATVNSALTLMK